MKLHCNMVIGHREDILASDWIRSCTLGLFLSSLTRVVLNLWGKLKYKYWDTWASGCSHFWVILRIHLGSVRGCSNDCNNSTLQHYSHQCGMREYNSTSEYLPRTVAKQNTAELLRGRITGTIVSKVLTLDTNYLKSRRDSDWTIVWSNPTDWSEVWVDSRNRLNISLIIKMKITVECPSDCDVAAKICKTLSL